MADQTTVQRVAVSGEFTIFTAAAVRDQLLAALDAADEIEVDLARVSEIDSAGLQIMVAAKREAAERHKALRFAGHSAAIVDILEFTELGAYFGDPILLHSGS